jgi:signal transduction histidine kinase
MSVDISPEARTAVVVGDVLRVQQILNALLGNAVKFTVAGEIRFTVDPHGEGFRFSVADTGVGFDPDHKEGLFAAFQQADGSSTRRHGGIGLGLSVARGLAGLMGGTLEANLREGGGSIFTLDLPLPVAGRAQRAVA